MKTYVSDLVDGQVQAKNKREAVHEFTEILNQSSKVQIDLDMDETYYEDNWTEEDVINYVYQTC